MSFDQKEYFRQYDKENYDRIIIRVYAGNKKNIQEKAAEIGISVQALIIRALEKQYGIKFSE